MAEKKYSQYGLVNKKIKELNDKGLLDRILNWLANATDKKEFPFEIKVPNDLYFRAEVLCDDVVQRREKDKDYLQSELVEHIFLDFLDEVRKNDGNIGTINSRLKARIRELPMSKEQPLIPSKSTQTVLTKIDREDVLRAEILLQDLSHFSNNEKLTVEKLIEIVYLDFLVEYNKGRRKNVMKEILEYID